jgi:hypothetical protein
MSPRAAWRLESLGFERVYDYVAGKADWFAAGLPREGTGSTLPRARDVVREAAATCVLSDRVGEAALRARAAGQTGCLVLTEGRVLLGRVRDLEADSDALVEEVMESGPTTVRSDDPLEPLVARLLARDVPQVIVTTSDGVLVGLLDRVEAEAHLAEGDRAEEDGPSCCD